MAKENVSFDFRLKNRRNREPPFRWKKHNDLMSEKHKIILRL